MADPLPDPLVPVEVDLRDLDGFMLNVERLLASELNAIATPEEKWAALMLWCRAWKQVPAASLPDDERVLAAFSGAGARWRKVRANAMRGFVKCTDGRFHHRVLAVEANAAWKRKQAFQQQRERDRKRLEQWREERRGNGRETRFKPPDETPSETRFEREGQGQGQGQGQGGDRESVPVIEKTDPTEPLGPREKNRAAAQRDELLEIPPFLDRTKRGSRLSPDWQLPEEWRTAAIEARERNSLPTINLDFEAERFANYWQSKAGGGATKTDWRKTWINWALKAENHGNRTRENTKFRNGFAELIARGHLVEPGETGG